MAFLLGNESCIDSLRSDLQDIQSVIQEVTDKLVSTTATAASGSASGGSFTIRCYSWKSPDKLASDLNIRELLDRFKFGKDESDNQFSHYSLLELIIDRLLLLIYMSTTVIENTAPDAAKTSAQPMSIARLNAGLTIKKFWNKFIQMNATIRHLNSQIKISQAKLKALESTSALKSNPNSSSTPIPAQGKPSIDQNATNRTEDETPKSRSETPFVPCQFCAKVQANLKANADQLINMCHYQDITSQVGKYRSSLNGGHQGWLSGGEVEKWLIEQDKDLNRIAKQLEFLSKNNELLKTKLAENEAQAKKMQSVENELKKQVKDEKETLSITMKQYEKKLQDQKFEMQTKINNLENELKQLGDIRKNLDEKNEHLKSLNENNEKIINELTEANKSLNQELSAKNESSQRRQRAEEDLLVKTTELDCLRRELGEKANELAKERERLELSIRNEQSMKLKHEAALESMDKLTAELETLRKRSNNCDELSNKVAAKQNQIENLEAELSSLHKLADELRSELKKKKENEILLLKYPDLYGPVEDLHSNAGPSEANVMEDMYNQVNANKYRISLLENLNQTLMNSIRKLNETSTNKLNDSAHSAASSVKTRKASLSSVDLGLDSSHGQKPTFFQASSSPKSNRQAASGKEITEPDPSRNASRNQMDRQYPPRPVPLFKLDTEINEKPATPLQKPFWNPNESVATNQRSNSNSAAKTVKAPDSGRFDGELSSKRQQIADVTSTEADDDEGNQTVNYDDEEEFDFLKDKQEADKNFLNQLRQFSKPPVTDVDPVEFDNYMKTRQNISSRLTDALTSPGPMSPHNTSMRQAAQSRNSSRNNSQFVLTNSRLASYSPSNPNRQNGHAKPPMTPIPPADKNMEVVVGKGRRVSSATGSRSNSANGQNGKTAEMPSTPTSAKAKPSTNLNNSRNKPNAKPGSDFLDNSRLNSSSSHRTADFRCQNCEKAYANLRDFDIHKLYCN